MKAKTTTKEEYQERINRLVEYINTHLDGEIDLNFLAEMSGFSRWHFHRIVSAFLGEPLGAFIVRMRIETAARWLRYSDLPIQEIAYRVGYDVPSSLSKVFRQFYGISPNQYRIDKTFHIMQPEKVQPDLQLQAEVKDVPQRQVIYICRRGDYRQVDYAGTWKSLQEFARSQGASFFDPSPLCIYHDDPKVTPPERLRTDICMTVSEEVAPRGEVGRKSVLGGRYAVFLYKGPYTQLQSVYDTIYSQLIPRLECTLRDSPSSERYLNDPVTTAPADLLTEIYIAVE